MIPGGGVSSGGDESSQDRVPVKQCISRKSERPFPKFPRYPENLHFIKKVGVAL